MSVGDRITSVITENTDDGTTVLYLIVAVSTALGAAHHLDHLVRGNHVGWPASPEVNAFTYSLVIYPLVAIGLYLTMTDRPAIRYWTAVLAFSTVTLLYFHLSPWAVEPPGDVILPYADPVVGYAAFGILLALIASVTVGTGYALVIWRRRER